jgi:soluble cytochrome b562
MDEEAIRADERRRMVALIFSRANEVKSSYWIPDEPDAFDYHSGVDALANDMEMLVSWIQPGSQNLAANGSYNRMFPKGEL